MFISNYTQVTDAGCDVPDLKGGRRAIYRQHGPLSRDDEESDAPLRTLVVERDGATVLKCSTRALFRPN